MKTNKIMANDTTINAIFADLKRIADQCEKKHLTFMFSASIYNMNKEYTNEMHANNIGPEESRILLYMHSEEVTKNQITNLLIKK